MRKSLKVLFSILILLMTARIILPFAVQRYVNRTLDELPDYDGHIGDVDIHLYRGAYQIENIEIVKTTGDIPTPFFKVDKMDLSVEWKQLLNRSFVGEIVFIHPEINFVVAPSKKETQVGKGQGWTKTVKALFPVKINRLETKDGSLHYRDFHGKPEVDIYLSSVNIVVKNLNNSEKVSKTMMATLAGTGKVMGEADMHVAVGFNPYEKEPAFDLNLELQDLSLAKLNSFFRHYADIDVEKGTLSLFMEAAAKDGYLKGYAKPFLKDLDVMDLKKEKLTFTQTLKEGSVELIGKIFKNKKQKTTATRIAFSEKLKDPDVDIFGALGSSIHHVLIQALQPHLENSVKLGAEKKGGS